MGCGSSTDASSPRPKPQRGAGGAKGAKGRGKQTQRKTSKVPVNEKGYKKRIRENLRDATAGNDIEQLEKTMEVFVNNHLEDGGDYSEAETRMEFLLIRKDIRDACLRRHPVVLEKAIKRVEASPYKRQLKPYLDRAYYLKQHQNEQDTFRHDISDLDQTTVSEIRSYHHPPPGVHETMISVYMILGYPEDHLVDWTEITALMGRYGKDSLLREVSQADTRNIDNATSLRARNYLGQYSLEEVRSVSNGAAAFYVWSSQVVGKYDGKGKGGDTGTKTLTNSRVKSQSSASKSGNQPKTPTSTTRPDPGKDKKNEKQQQNTKQQQQQNAKQEQQNAKQQANAKQQQNTKQQQSGKQNQQQQQQQQQNKKADPLKGNKQVSNSQNAKQVTADQNNTKKKDTLYRGPTYNNKAKA
ncbi:uncharacterized protein LOC128229072 isoform X2 [Mya arenaria]|uniref:uncharacterized protein LOC128229072 isoform X2 n=1 Tax=Mya arenaria TaxID=6604 RepID=UPI0022E743F3|nr:uncharacterized protein LOC128229072 isoform X2 [Mya arenaria]